MSVSQWCRVYHMAIGPSRWVQRHSDTTQDLGRGKRRRVEPRQPLETSFDRLGERHKIDSSVAGRSSVSDCIQVI